MAVTNVTSWFGAGHTWTLSRPIPASSAVDVSLAYAEQLTCIDIKKGLPLVRSRFPGLILNIRSPKRLPYATLAGR